MCVLIGIAIGFVATGIRIAVDYLTEYRLETTWGYMHGGYTKFIPMCIFVGFNVAFALIASLPALFIQPLSGGSGIPEVKAFLNGIEMPKTFNVVTLLGKIWSLIFSFSSGLALGPEGPMVHIATMIAAGLSSGRSKTLNFDLRLFLTFRNHGDKRDFVTIGTAAGMAAAFGAPVGGVLFALEETASYWTRTLALRTFFCCMIATFTVNILLNIGYNVAQDYGLLTLSISGVYTYHWAELVSFSLIGVTGKESFSASLASSTSSHSFLFFPFSLP
jgi:chloride channel 7